MLTTKIYLVNALKPYNIYKKKIYNLVKYFTGIRYNCPTSR